MRISTSPTWLSLSSTKFLGSTSLHIRNAKRTVNQTSFAVIYGLRIDGHSFTCVKIYSYSFLNVFFSSFFFYNHGVSCYTRKRYKANFLNGFVVPRIVHVRYNQISVIRPTEIIHWELLTVEKLKIYKNGANACCFVGSGILICSSLITKEIFYNEPRLKPK